MKKLELKHLKKLYQIYPNLPRCLSQCYIHYYKRQCVLLVTSVPTVTGGAKYIFLRDLDAHAKNKNFVETILAVD
jgi:hypothetical protein